MKKPKISLTDDEWELYLQKYGKLISYISHRINGDSAISSYDDNEAELKIAAIESIIGFNKLTDKSFEEMILAKEFDSYTKTVLWNYKNNKGNKIKNKYVLNNNTVDIAEHADSFSDNSAPDLVDLNLTDDEKRIYQLLFTPGVYKKNVGLNIYKLTKESKKSSYHVNKTLDSLFKKLRE